MDILSHKDSLWKSANDKNSEIRWKTANKLCVNFKTIEKNLREKLLKKFLKDFHPGVRMKAVEAAAGNFLIIDKNLRNYIINSAASDNYFNVRKKVLVLINDNFENIEYEFLKKLLNKAANDESSSVRCEVVRVIDNNFNNFLDTDSRMLGPPLQKFCDDPHTDVKIASVELLINHYDKLKSAEALARKLADKKHPEVIKRLMKIKEKLPGDLQEILKKSKPRKMKRKRVPIMPSKPHENEIAISQREGVYDELEIRAVTDHSAKFINTINNSRVSPGVKKILIQLVREDIKYGHIVSNALTSGSGLVDVLKNLSASDESHARITAASLINKNFYVISEDEQEKLLKKLTSDPDADVRKNAALVIVKNFNQVTMPVQEELFRKLIVDPDESVRIYVQRLINRNFSKILKNISGEVLLNLIRTDFPGTEKDENTYELINLKFHGFLENQKIEVIKILMRGDSHSQEIASDLIYKNFDATYSKNLREEYLRMLTCGDSYARGVCADILSENFDNISRDTREEILRKLVNDPDAYVKKHAIDALCSNFDETKKSTGYSRLSEKLFVSWVGQLIKNRDVKAAYIITKNWYLVPDEFKKKFKELAKGKSPYMRRNVVLAMNRNFNNLIINPQDEIENLIQDLAKDPDKAVRKYISCLIAKNYKKVSRKTGNFLKILSDDPDPEVRSGTANAILLYYKNLPQNICEKLKDIAKDPDPVVRKELAEALRKNEKNIPADLIHELPEEIREMAEKSKHEEELISSKLKEITAEEVLNLIKDVNKGTFPGGYENKITRKYAYDLINLKYNDISEDEQHEMIKILSCGDTYAKKTAADIISENFDNTPKDMREEILKKLVDDPDKEVKKHALNALCSNFGSKKIPAGIISEKLFKSWLSQLVKSKDANDRSTAARVIAKNWKIVSKEFKDDFKKLVRDRSPRVRQSVAAAMTEHFHSLIINTQNRNIQELSKDHDEGVRGSTARLIAKNYKNVSGETRKCLKDLAEDDDSDVRASAASAIAAYYKNLPWDVCEKLKHLAEDPSTRVRKEVGMALGWNEKNLPKNLIHEFPEEIQEIAEKSKTKEEIGEGGPKLKFQKMKLRLFRR